MKRLFRYESFVSKNSERIDDDNFKNWFGDSKVVDGQGKPLIVYHGSKTKFDRFDAKKKGSGTDEGIRGRGFYFSSNAKSAQSYGPNLMRVYLRMEKPFDLLGFGSLEEMAEFLEIDPSILHERGRGTPQHSVSVSTPFAGVFAGSVREKGFDGIVHGQEFVVFEPNQIKSVENDGSWDLSDDNVHS